MPTKISIVIPTKNSSATLPRLLSSINNQSYKSFEVIVVDNHSDDNTCKIAKESGARVFIHGPERSAQRNFGALVACFDALLFLDSDMELSSGVLQYCGEAITSYDALCIREIVVSSGDYWGKARTVERESYFGSLYLEAARCIRRSIFNMIGRYNTQLTGLEDMALQAELVDRNCKVGWIVCPIIHHEEDITLKRYLFKRHRYGQTDHLFRASYPEYWKYLRSVTFRLKILLKYFSRKGRVAYIAFLPGIIIMRGIEALVRT